MRRNPFTGRQFARSLSKAKTYVSWGTNCVWIIDPEKRTAWNVSRQNGAVWIPPDGALCVEEIEIKMSDLFDHVDRKLGRNAGTGLP